LWGAIAAAVVLGLLAAAFAGQLRQRAGPGARPSPTARSATPTAVALPPLAAFPGWHAVLRFGASAITIPTTSATSGTFSVAGPYAIDIACVGRGTVTVNVAPEVSFTHTCGPTPVLEHDEYAILKSAAHVRRTLIASAAATGDVTWEALIEVEG
jgi:hypothetical protein